MGTDADRHKSNLASHLTKQKYVKFMSNAKSFKGFSDRVTIAVPIKKPFDANSLRDYMQFSFHCQQGKVEHHEESHVNAKGSSKLRRTEISTL